MKRSLPPHPSLTHLRHQAKDLLRLHRAGDPEAIARFREHSRLSAASESTIRAAPLSLSDAQLVIAREYGFASWPKLKLHVDSIQKVEDRVSWLRTAFATADQETRARLLSCVHTKERFQHYDPDASELSEEDARLVVANEEGYAFWTKYESYLYLHPEVQQVIAAVRAGHLSKLKAMLRADPAAANPHWVRDDRASRPIPNDSIPLHCVSEAVFDGTNRQGNDYELTRALIRAGAAVDVERGTPLLSAVSYNARGAVKALLEGGAAVDGVNGDGAPMAYALYFGFTDIAESLAQHGARLDLRFAAGLGKLEVVKSFFNADSSLKPDAGRLADPFENRWRCERTRANVLSQALFFACVNARIETADFLLERGAEIDAVVPGMDPSAPGTVLHWLTCMSFGAAGDHQAIEKHRLPTIEFLLKRGASVAVRDPAYHSTPLGWARHFGREQMIELLLPHAGIHDAVALDAIDRLHALLAHDEALANARDDLGQTPLHHLHGDTRRGDEAIDLLVAHGADVNARDDRGATPWSKLVACGRADLAERLRSRGAIADE